MKRLSICLLFLFFVFRTVSQETTPNIPLPSAPQLRWHLYEQIMFVHFSPAAWQGREYDNQSTPLEEMKMSALDTDQWCEVAKSWDAKMVLFVAKHVGGFCWWQTQTTDYSIRSTPWKNGQGDVMKELSESCKKYGLDLGVYIYPGDDQWGAGIGSGGITSDPALQEEYSKVFRQQLTEVLSNYGPIREVWFDGNCHIPIKDILEKYAKDAVIFQGKSATLRWVGNEDGIAPDPNWYTIKKEDLETGVATALHSDVDGDAYAPVEADVPLLKNGGHKWFWAPNIEHLLMNTEQLMDLYYRSVGRGSVLLLNSTPDTSGVIPASHVEVYKAFGKEITSRFSNPLQTTSGEGDLLTLSFSKPQEINHVILQEDIAKGQRVKKYVIEGSTDGSEWKTIYQGTSIGNKKIDHFPTVNVRKIRVRFIDCKATPVIKNFSAYHIQSTSYSDLNNASKAIQIGYWEASTYDEEHWKELEIDLTPYVNSIGQYDISFQIAAHDYLNRQPTGLLFKDWSLEIYGQKSKEAIEKVGNNSVFRITRSQQTLDEYKTIFRVWIKRNPSKSSGSISIQKLTY
ncbi:alpha-L-fucosidase [Parabacteroides sp. OttesenSCG-928-G06]|nr:alpha-L-fucosidase [Parabacteroides sp. OttesenSCG-928-G06]